MDLSNLLSAVFCRKKGKPQNISIFWSGFQNSQEGQSTRNQADKGQTLIRKLRQKVKVEDEDCVKLEEFTEPAKEDCESKQHPDDSENKDLQFIHKETQPIQNDTPAETFIDENIALTEKVSADEENTKVQKQSPTTVLSEDETYLLEDDKFPVIDKTKVGTKKNFTVRRIGQQYQRKGSLKLKNFPLSSIKEKT